VGASAGLDWSDEDQDGVREIGCHGDLALLGGVSFGYKKEVSGATADALEAAAAWFGLGPDAQAT